MPENRIRYARGRLVLLAIAAFFLFFARAIQAATIDPALNRSFEGTRSVWVVFRDKDVADASRRRAAESQARTSIAAHARARRALRGDPRLPTAELDLPVGPRYVRSVLATGAPVRFTSRWFNAVTVDATEPQVRAIAALPFVARVEPVRKLARLRDWVLSPPSPAAPAREAPRPLSATALNYGNSFAPLNIIRVPEAHQAGYDGSGIVVGIMDVGFFKSHECLAPLPIVNEWDFVFNDANVQRDLTNPQDFSDFHGTAVWSLLAGFKEGAQIGPAYRASFLLAKTEDLNREPPADEDRYVAGLEWMEANGADVVSASLAYLTFDDGSGYSFAQLDGRTAKCTIAADLATSLGIVVCSAAGNSGPALRSIWTPADALRTISCGSVNLTRGLSTFSSRGPTADGRIKPEVCAPGQAVQTASENRSGNQYIVGSGTSFATPLIGGAAALILQAHPSWPPAAVREALMQTADHRLSPTNGYGWGIIDVMAAIRYNRSLAANPAFWKRL